MELHKNDNIRDLEYWKEKYLDTLDETEQKERQWGELEDLLRDSIARLAVAGYGVNSRLDSKLDELRSAVRRNRDAQQLDALIRNINETAARLKDPEQSPFANPFVVLTRLVEGVEFPAGLRKSSRQLRKKLVSAADGDDPKPLVYELARLLQRGLEGGTENHPSSRLTRFWGAVASRAKNAGNSTETRCENVGSSGAEASVLQRILDRSELPKECRQELHALQGRIDEGKSTVTPAELIDEVVRFLSKWMRRRDFAQTERPASSELPLNQVLQELLLRLDVPEAMRSRVEALRISLHEDVNSHELPAILESIVGLITDMRRNVRQERQEIEQFLKTITDRLVRIDSNLQAAERSRREALGDGQTLGSTVREQVTHLRASMAQASDFGQLKRAVNSGLDAVQEHMEIYVLAEEKRSVEAERRIHALLTQLHDVRKSAGNLQEQMKQQRAQAICDGLTGLYNRLAYDERIQQDFAHWNRYKDPLSLLVIDVDHFKVLNDTFGHQTGDRALKVLAEQLQSNVREADFAARYGGEEFIIILPKTKCDYALKVAEKLRRRVEKCKFHYRGQPVPITVSCGVAEFHEGDTPESVFQRGDEALYQAKRDGRNRCYAENWTR